MSEEPEEQGGLRFTRRFRETGPDLYPVWKVSTAYAGLGLAIAGLFFVAPHLRWLPLPSGVMLPLTLIAMAVPLAALIWAMVGFGMRAQRRTAALALAVALALGAIGADAAAFWFDDIRPEYLYRMGWASPPASGESQTTTSP